MNSRTQVAHLNASLVGGKTASALQTKAIHDELPVSTSAVPNATYTLPTMPAGSYQVSFDVDALMTVSGQVINCGVMEHGTMTNLLLAYGSSYETYSAVSGAGVITSTDGALDFRCFASDGDFRLFTGGSAEVGFVKLDSVASHTVGPPVTMSRNGRRTVGG